MPNPLIAAASGSFVVAPALTMSGRSLSLGSGALAKLGANAVVNPAASAPENHMFGVVGITPFTTNTVVVSQGEHTVVVHNSLSTITVQDSSLTGVRSSVIDN